MLNGSMLPHSNCGTRRCSRSAGPLLNQEALDVGGDGQIMARAARRRLGRRRSKFFHDVRVREQNGKHMLVLRREIGFSPLALAPSTNPGSAATFRPAAVNTVQGPWPPAVDWQAAGTRLHCLAVGSVHRCRCHRLAVLRRCCQTDHREVGATARPDFIAAAG